MKKRSATSKRSKSSADADRKARTSDLPEWFTISDLDQLKILSNKLRARILAQFAEREQTAKQVAQRLGESPTKLYRHVDALLEHGLIVPTRQEQKRGTVQKFYRAVARRFRVDDACFADEDAPAATRVGLVLELLNELGSDLTQLSADFADEYVSAMSAMAMLPKSNLEAAGQEIFDAVFAILDKYNSNDRRRASVEYRVSVVVQPFATKKKQVRRKKK